MNAKKYAEELIDKFLLTYNEYCDLQQAKQCSLLHLELLKDRSEFLSDSLEDRIISKNHAECFFSEVEEGIRKFDKY